MNVIGKVVGVKTASGSIPLPARGNERGEPDFAAAMASAAASAAETEAPRADQAHAPEENLEPAAEAALNRMRDALSRRGDNPVAPEAPAEGEAPPPPPAPVATDAHVRRAMSAYQQAMRLVW